MRDLVYDQKTCQSVSLFNFKGRKHSLEYERIRSRSIGSAYHYSRSRFAQYFLWFEMRLSISAPETDTFFYLCWNLHISLRRGRTNLTLVRSAKQRREHCSGPPTDSTKYLNYRKCVSNFLSSWSANLQWLLQKANHGTYSNPGTQLGAENKDFGSFIYLAFPN